MGRWWTTELTDDLYHVFFRVTTEKYHRLDPTAKLEYF